MKKIIRLAVYSLLFIFAYICVHLAVLKNSDSKIINNSKIQYKKVKQYVTEQTLNVVKKLNLHQNKIIENSRSATSLDPEYVFSEADMLDENNQTYTILIWSNRPGKPGYLANPKVCSANISCDISYDSKLLGKAHAVVFNNNRVINQDHVAGVRKPHQLYTWWEQESPLHGSGPNEPSEYFYNLTFHYRLDADIYAPYGSIHLILNEIKANGEDDLDSLLLRKSDPSKLVIWAVSNCYSRRMNYAKKLIESGLKVDGFGKCFGDRRIGDGAYSNSFYSEISKYKFYLAFENSYHCKDYLTEKFWFNSLRAGVVPIVWGPLKSDVEKVAPQNSFIYAEDFNSPKELVDYVNYLASNMSEYRRYLEWREWIKYPQQIQPHLQMRNRKNDLRSFCLLCAMVQNAGKRRKEGKPEKILQVRHANSNWHNPEKGRCLA